VKILSIFPIYIFLFYLLNFVFIKHNILLDKYYSSAHKEFLGKNSVPVSGGILFFSFILFYLENLTFYDFTFYFCILFVGILSDINKLSSASKRLLLQSLTIIIYIVFSNVYINETRLVFLDLLLENNIYIKVLFTTLCILILINGFNFIDGANTLAGGYAFIICLGLLLFSSKKDLNYELNNIYYLLSFLFVFLIYNFYSKSYLGDGGSYLISIFLAITCIKFASQFQNLMSPFFIAVLLWYPALENLFSIIRRVFYQKKNANLADNQHLHHLIYKFLKKKIKNKKICNSLTGLSINLVLFVFIYFAVIFANQTILLVSLIILKSFTYTLVYSGLRDQN